MRNILAIAAAATMGLGAWQTASAADLPVKAAPPAVVAPITTWTGCYIGGNLGGGWGTTDVAVVTPGGAFVASRDRSAFVAGGQIGCDYQTGAFVFGARNLTDWSNLRTNRFIDTGVFAGDTITVKSNWFDLLTGRIGWAVQPAWLLYAQGGAAWRNRSVELFVPPGFVAETSNTRTGWTVGGGTEYMVAPNWSIFAEYNFAQFGTNTVSFITPAGVPFAGNVKTDVQTVLVGFNWRPRW